MEGHSSGVGSGGQVISDGYVDDGHPNGIPPAVYGEGTGRAGEGGSAGSDAEPNCGLRWSDAGCDACMQSKCRTPCGICADNQGCFALMECLGGAEDQEAINTCQAAAPQDAVDGLLGLLGPKEGCLTLECPMCIEASSPSDSLPNCVAYYEVGGCCALVTDQPSCSESLKRFEDQVVADPGKASSTDSACLQRLLQAASGGFCLPTCTKYYGEGGCCAKQTAQSGCTQTLDSYNAQAAEDPKEIPALEEQCKASMDYATSKGSCD